MFTNKHKMRRNKFTVSYLRFHRQVIALQKGKIKLVKKLAMEARNDLELQTNLSQLKLGYSI